jgi:hypothetical protein
MMALAYWIVLLSDTAQAKADPVSEEQLTEQLTRTIAEVRTGETSSDRTDAAERLAQLTRDLDPKKVNEATLIEMVSLLNTTEDSVRAWVAASLGHIGPRAKVAVPTLLKLLPVVDCLPGELTSASAIRAALERLNETPPPPSRCEICWEVIDRAQVARLSFPRLAFKQPSDQPGALTQSDGIDWNRIVPPPELIQPYAIEIGWIGASHWKQRYCHIVHRASNGSLQIH